MRSLTLISLATSAAAFQSMSSTPFIASNSALHSTAPSPFYAETVSVKLEQPASQSIIGSQPTDDQQQEKRVVINKKPAAVAKNSPAHKGGIFSPMVLFIKGVLGDEKLNKVRAKAINMHSDVIAEFVKTSESTFGDAVLRSLFSLADKDGSGTIDEDELRTALQSLGFSWLQDKQVAGIFTRADVDGNGAIDLDEWMREAPKTLRTNLTKLAKKNGGDLGFLV